MRKNSPGATEQTPTRKVSKSPNPQRQGPQEVATLGGLLSERQELGALASDLDTAFQAAKAHALALHYRREPGARPALRVAVCIRQAARDAQKAADLLHCALAVWHDAGCERMATLAPWMTDLVEGDAADVTGGAA